MSPIAYSQSWPGTRLWASTGIVLPGSRPTTSSPRSSVDGCAAERDEDLVGDHAGAVVVLTETVPSPAGSTASAFCAVRMSTPCPRSASVS